MSTQTHPAQTDPNALTWPEVAEMALDPEPAGMGPHDDDLES